jgi:hypothetical protein
LSAARVPAAFSRSPARPARVLRWPSTAHRPALALPRCVAAATALGADAGVPRWWDPWSSPRWRGNPP